MNVTMTWAVRSDLNVVIEIENEIFDDPWTLGFLHRTLRARNTITYVLKKDEVILGYLIYELRKKEIRIIRMAVTPSAQRVGYGQYMVDCMLERLQRQKRDKLSALVDDSNVIANDFFRKCGLTVVGVSRRYFDNGQDAYLMEISK